MVPFKQVVVLFQPVTQSVLANRTLGNPKVGGGWKCQAYIEDLTPFQAYQEWGIELKSPAVLQFDVADWNEAAGIGGMQILNGKDIDAGLAQTSSEFAAFMVDAQVSVLDILAGSGAFAGRVYTCKGRAAIYDEGLPGDHIAILLDQKEHPL